MTRYEGPRHSYQVVMTASQADDLWKMPGYADVTVERLGAPSVVHVLTLSEWGWSVEHPGDCAHADRTECPVYRAATHSLIESGIPGRFRVTANAEATKLMFLGNA